MSFIDWVKDVVSAPVEEETEQAAQNNETEEEAVEEQAAPVVRNPFQKAKEPAQSAVRSAGDLKVVLASPETFEDGRAVAGHVNQKRTVVLNLEKTNKDICRRLIDFLSGVAFANGGQLKRVANSTYMITPKSVDIMGDMIVDEFENSGLFNINV